MTARSIPEWIGASPDAAIPRRVRARLFTGRCAICTRKLMAGERWEADHVVALINGGEHRESNLRCVCTWCHRQKTAGDVAEAAKVRRTRSKHIGLRKPRSITQWRRFDRTPVHAPRER